MYNQCITLTFSECVENHVDHEQIGTKREFGISYDYLVEMYNHYNYNGVYNMEFYNLNENSGIPEIQEGVTNAAILIIRNGVDTLLENQINKIEEIKQKIPYYDINRRSITDLIYNEQNNLTPDSKIWSNKHGGVVNKNARWNLCFANEGHKSNFQEKKGTVVPFNQVPYTQLLRDNLHNLIGDDAYGLYAEGNYYYNPNKCGIGYHGDTERSIVIGTRLGVSIPLCYQWYYKSNPMGNNIKFILNHGDIYIMSNKATGNDWKKRNIYTLRHAAGCNDYIIIKPKKNKNITNNANKVRNPVSGRMINIGGGVYKKLVKQGYVF